MPGIRMWFNERSRLLKVAAPYDPQWNEAAKKLGWWDYNAKLWCFQPERENEVVAELKRLYNWEP